MWTVFELLFLYAKYHISKTYLHTNFSNKTHLLFYCQCLLSFGFSFLHCNNTSIWKTFNFGSKNCGTFFGDFFQKRLFAFVFTRNLRSSLMNILKVFWRLNFDVQQPCVVVLRRFCFILFTLLAFLLGFCSKKHLQTTRNYIRVGTEKTDKRFREENPRFNR